MARAILYIIPAEQYLKAVTSIIKKEVSEQNIIYITTNKPQHHLAGMLKKDNIDTDKIFFIDCISRQIGAADKEPRNCFFLDSPQHITGLSLAISRAVKEMPGQKVVLLDSLSTLLIYNDELVVGRFSNFFVNTMRLKNASTIMIALESDVERGIIKTIESFVDEVVKWHMN